MHEAGRDSLKKRLLDQDHLLDQTRVWHASKVQALEELRSKEMTQHAQRVDQVRDSVNEVLDQMRRARLNIDEWARATKGYEALVNYLHEEKGYAESFVGRQLELARDQFESERGRTRKQLDQLEGALAKAGGERLDLQGMVKTSMADAEARRIKEAEMEATILRERLYEAGVAARSREAVATEQLAELKTAFRSDVAALAQWVEQLRGETLKANVYARSSTRLLRQQNVMLKKRLGHNAHVAKQKQRRLIAWLGWRLVVQQSKAIKSADERRHVEVGERESMLDTIEARLGQTRQKYIRQLHTLQTAHEAELEAAEEELRESQEAMSRLKTFSAHKLSEMADQLEAAKLAANGAADEAAVI